MLSLSLMIFIAHEPPKALHHSYCVATITFYLVPHLSSPCQRVTIHFFSSTNHAKHPQKKRQLENDLLLLVLGFLLVAVEKDSHIFVL